MNEFIFEGLIIYRFLLWLEALEGVFYNERLFVDV